MPRQYQVRFATQLPQLEAYLNQSAAQGWRLATLVTTHDLGTTEHFVAVMERE